jgi:malate dehydrogenase
LAAKITIVGAGNVGATTAHWAATKELGDVVLIDIVEGMPQGKALDLAESAPLEGFDCRLVGTNDYADTAHSDVVVVTAGIARKPGMSRDDLLHTNARIVSTVVSNLVQYSPNAYMIFSTLWMPSVYVAAGEWLAEKPCDGHGRCAGFGVFDATLLRLGVSVEDVHGFVMGGHGDTMVPCHATRRWRAFHPSCCRAFIAQLVQRTRDGAEIVNFLKQGVRFMRLGRRSCR